MTPASAAAVGTRGGVMTAPARLSREVGVKGRGGNRLARPQATIIAAQRPAQQALPRNMTGWETPAGDAARPLPAQDAAPWQQPAPFRLPRTGRGAARPGNGTKRQVRTDSLTPVPREDGAPVRKERNVVSPAPCQHDRALRPDDGRSAPIGTPHHPASQDPAMTHPDDLLREVMTRQARREGNAPKRERQCFKGGGRKTSGSCDAARAMVAAGERDARKIVAECGVSTFTAYKLVKQAKEAQA